MEKIEGLSIGLDLDSIRLERGLKGVKDSLRTVNTEMRANMSAFDRGDRSVGKYETRLDGLNKKLDVQKAAVKEAKSEYEKMVDEHGKGSIEAEKAAREYNNQAAALNNLERYVERTKDELIELKKEQAIADSNWTKAGGSLKDYGGKLEGVGTKAKDIGGSLTKWLTIPALGVATAIGGITAAFGWGRLVGLDSAQAQLRGLGYEAEDVERISDGLVEALDGGMMTMAEATSAAATAMAAGVEEGDELARYIQILDSAVVGGTGSFAEMEQIFGRIVDQGKMTRGEFDMISQRMPGFSSAVQEHMGVSSEEMYEMLSAGEIATNEFLDIMEGFAGDMATEYSKSWEGMLQNTKAYIGIIGENLLSGVFEKSKESIGQFIELLKSDAVMDWASQMGQKIGDTFTKIVDSVKTGIEWFIDLESWQQKLIGSVAGFAVALGPLLTIFGTLIIFVGKVATALGSFFQWIGKQKALATFAKTAGNGASKVGLLSRAIGVLSGPVGWIITGITTLGAAFVTAYKKSDTFRNFADKLKDAFVTAYEKVKEFLTTNESFLGFIDSIKNGFSTVKDLIMQVFGVAMDFVKEKIADIKSFWDTNGTQILQAFQNVFSGIWSVVQPILNGIVDLVKWAFPYIKTIIGTALNVAFSIVKMIWGNIKGVIDGALNIIMGLVKTFSSLFTGDWSGMWEGIKQVLSGAVQFIWNFIQLSFFGKLIKGGVVFIKSFAGFFTSMWQGIRTTFSNVIKWIVEFVKNRFTSMQNTISNLTTGIRDLLSRIWNFIWNGIIKPIIKSIVDFVKNRFTSMRDTTSNIFTGIRDTAQRLWNAVKEKIWNPVKNVVKNVKDRFTTLKDNVSGIFSNMRDNVADWIGRMIKAVTDMPGKMANGLRTTASKIGDALASVGNTMLGTLGKGVNGVIAGINWVLDKLGISSKISEWKVPTVGAASSGSKMSMKGVPAGIAEYAHGTDGHPGGPAIVGDGVGRNAGRELIRFPNGKELFSPATPTLMPNMPKGTHVLSALDTKEYLKAPRYMFGTIGNGFKSAWNGIQAGASWTWDKTKQGANAVKDTALDVWSYVDDPSKLLNKALDALGVFPEKIVGAFKELPVKGFNKIKDGGIDFLKKKIDELFSSDGGFSGFSFPSPFRQSSGFGPRSSPGGIGSTNHKGIDFAAPIGTPIPAQAPGTVSFSGWSGGYGNLVKTRSGPFEYLYGHNSKNLVKQGNTVKKGQIIAEVGSTGNSTGPHVHFEIRKNGTAINPNSIVSGGSGGNLSKWIGAGMARAGVSGSSWRDGLSWIIGKESSGRPRAVGANTSTGTAKGLMQLKDFNYSGDPFDPVNNIFHGIKYIKGRYGSIGKALSWHRKNNWYGTGGRIGADGLYRLSEEGHPEYVIPTAPNRRTEAMKLLALAGKEISGNKRPHQLPNVAGNNDRQYDYDRAEEISLLRQQVELLTQLVLSSQNIEAKPVLTEGDIKRSYDKRDSRESAKHGIFTGRPGGAY